MRARVQRADGRLSLSQVEDRLNEIRGMNVPELQKLWRQLYGEPTRTRNKDYLRKKLSFRVQELAEGGLSPRARARVAELAESETENETRRRESRKKSASYKTPAAREKERERDPRLPRVGTVLEREYDDKVHSVTVHENDFEYDGERYPSLSMVAGEITGKTWNGFVFFGLNRRQKRGRR